MKKKNAARERRSTSGNVGGECNTVYPFYLWKYTKVYKVSQIS